MRMSKFIVGVSIIILFYTSCDYKNEKDLKVIEDKTVSNLPRNLTFILLSHYPHDTTSFTEGLFINGKEVYESTGAPEELPQTRSLFGITNLQTGVIDEKVELNKNIYFGEGIVKIKNKIYQLTYKNRIGFIYDAKNYKKLGQFEFESKEGWGLTTDGNSLIMSDGTNIIKYISIKNFKIEKELIIKSNNLPVHFINELEYVNGNIYANVWTTNDIIKIDTTTGKVIGKVDLSILYEDSKSNYQGSLEMNGIAYDSIEKNFIITGKLWPKMYRISIQ